MPRSERKNAVTSPISIEIYKQLRSRYNGMRSDFYKIVPVYMAIIGGLWSYAFSSDHNAAFLACLSAIFFIGLIFCTIMFDYGIELSVYELKISEIEKFDPISESSNKIHYNFMAGGRAENVIGFIFLANAVLALVLLHIISDAFKTIVATITVTMITVLIAALVYCIVFRIKTGQLPISKGKLVGWNTVHRNYPGKGA